MAVVLEVHADCHEVNQALSRAGTVVIQVVSMAAETVAAEAEAIAGARHRRLGRRWPTQGEGRWERRVVAPEWWAHFLAHGTRAHGPRRAPALHFWVGQNEVYAGRVAGIEAEHFDARAVEAAAATVDAIVARAFEEAVG